MKTYKVIMHDITYNKAEAYLNEIKAGKLIAGEYLQQKLKDKDISQLSVEVFIEQIIQTKKPQIFAESSVYGNGSDWNQTELSILGDISISVPVTVYDNGRHYKPEVHNNPFSATLLYTPGALLRNGCNETPADWLEVTTSGQINYQGYYSLYERRLLPVFLYLNSIAKNDKKAFLTIPGLGCGQFAGRFQGELGAMLKQVLIDILNKHGKEFSNIKAIYYDPYIECTNERLEINGISLLVRPLTEGNEGKSQLCEPQKYQEDSDDFSNCQLFSLVAWDHVSWPGNDFYVGLRSTDDGVKAAATNSMTIMTGFDGAYNSSTNTYDPVGDYKSWEEVISKNKIEIAVKNNLLVLPSYQ